MILNRLTYISGTRVTAGTPQNVKRHRCEIQSNCGQTTCVADENLKFYREIIDNASLRDFKFE